MDNPIGDIAPDTESSIEAKLPRRIYCDGVFDLFHQGHFRHLESIASFEPGPIQLIVGVVGDNDCRDYKRRPIWTLQQRTQVLRSLKVVYEVISPCPLVLTEEFIQSNQIDAVYHAFSSEEDRQKQAPLLAAPIKLGIFHGIPYNHGISTSQIIEKNGWDDIWERKGRSQDVKNVRLLTGYEGTDFAPDVYAEYWTKVVKWCEGESVLDVGCGAGFLGDFLPKKGYIGIEKAQSLADAFVERSKRVVIVHDAERLPFRDASFDHVISHSMLQYLPGKASAYRAIQEMIRVARKSVFLGDLRSVGHPHKQQKHVMEGTIQHTLFQRSDGSTSPILADFVVSDAVWGGKTRFNAFLLKNKTRL